jgi:hypothetical protein
MKNRFLRLLISLVAMSAAARAATTTWAATSFGPYKSTDGGVTWQPVKVTVSNALLQGIPDTVAIALDPSDSKKDLRLSHRTCTSAAKSFSAQ